MKGSQEIRAEINFDASAFIAKDWPMARFFSHRFEFKKKKNWYIPRMECLSKNSK